MGTVFATVSDHFPAATRGRSLGWVVTGQSLALVLGVPAMTLAGTVGGWRGPSSPTPSSSWWSRWPSGWWSRAASSRVVERQVPFRSLVRLVGPRVLALLFAGSTERVCYAAVAVFLPTYLLTRYAIDAPQLALGLGLVATGNLLGNILGGQLSDRLRAPAAVAGFRAGRRWRAGAAGAVWAPSVPLSIALGFVYTLVNATGRPPLLSLLSNVSNEARGAVLGLNITFSSLGWLGATALGGAVVGVAGFGGLAILTFAFGLLGGALAWVRGWCRDERARLLAVRASRRGERDLEPNPCPSYRGRARRSSWRVTARPDSKRSWFAATRARRWRPTRTCFPAGRFAPDDSEVPGLESSRPGA